MIFGRITQKTLEQSLYVSFYVGMLFLSTLCLSNRILMLYQANAPTLMPFSKEDKILIKNLYKCKGYNARQ